MKNTKASTLQLYLTVAFSVCMLVSNILTFKTVQVTDSIVFTSALVVFPITYILSDVFSEVYGYKWSRITCYIGFLTQLFAVLCFKLAIAMPYPIYWEDQAAFELVLGSTFRVSVASLVAYFFGDLANDIVFKKMKERHAESGEGFCARAVLSSYAGNLVDSTIFLTAAFAGIMSAKEIAVMIITESTIKSLYETIMVPVTKVVVDKVAKAEKK